MKIALCFSGQPRFVKETYQNYLDNLIIPNNIEDIFVHTWWDAEKLNEPLLTSWNDVGYHIKIFLESDTIEFIQNNYQPKKIITEKETFKHYIGAGEFGKIQITQPHIFQSMVNSIYKCNQLKKQYEEENNFKYDLVIRTRTDINILDKIDLSNLSLFNKLYIPGGIGVLNYDSINDQFAIGNSDIMDIYSNLYLCMNEFTNRKCFFNSEHLYYVYFVNILKMTDNIENLNINYKLIKIK
jgi:hypothetical protein